MRAFRTRRRLVSGAGGPCPTGPGGELAGGQRARGEWSGLVGVHGAPNGFGDVFFSTAAYGSGPTLASNHFAAFRNKGDGTF